MPPEEQQDESLQIEPGYVRGAVRRSDAQEVADAMAKAIEEVGEITDEDNEQAQADIEAGRPIDPGKGKGKKAEAAKEPEGDPAEEKPDAELGPDGKPKENEYAHERRRLRTAYEKREQELNARFGERDKAFQAAVTKHNEEVRRLNDLREAAECLDNGDLDDMAAALARFKGDDTIKDWTSLNDQGLKRIQNPSHKEMRKLRMDLKARDERERAAEEERRTTSQRERDEQQSRAAADNERKWQDGITHEITGDEDPAVAEILDIDPNFASWVFATQKRHHQEDGEVLPTAEAAVRTVKGLYQTMRKWTAWIEKHPESAFVKKITGQQAPSKPAKTEKGTASRNGETGTADRNGVRKGNTKVPPAVSQNRTAEASAVGRLSDREIIRRHAAAMDEQSQRERNERLSGGSP